MTCRRAWPVCPGLLVACLLATLVVASPALAGPEGSPSEQAEPAWWLLVLFTLNGVVIWYFSRKRYLVMKDGHLRPAFMELQEFSSYLLAGTVIAQLWVHGDPGSYAATNHAVLWQLPALDLDVTLHFLVNDVFMTFFFGVAAKELVEATTKAGGSLRGGQAVVPMMACVGGVVGPAIVFRLICTPAHADAWGVPCATDIAFAWLGARMIWGRVHPAVTFLLALAVADDFIGMGIIAIYYPVREFNPVGLVLLLVGVALALAMYRGARHFRMFRAWQMYLIAGVVCWFGLLLAGLHPALALVFVVPFIPMAGRDEGIFAENGHWDHDEELGEPLLAGQDNLAHDVRPGRDPINRFEHVVKPLVDTGLFFFGLANAGVAWWGASTWSRDSWAVFLGLGIGKTLGIAAFALLGYVLVRRRRAATSIAEEDAEGTVLHFSDLLVVGLLGAMGFTVALFVAEAAGGHPSLKLGALASFAYLAVAVVLGKYVLGIRPLQT